MKKKKTVPFKKISAKQKSAAKFAELRHEVALLNAIIETIPNMVFLKEAKELRFIRFNKAGQKLLGYSQKDLLGKNDYDFFPKEEADFFIQKDREVLKSRKVLDIAEEPIQTRKQGIRILHTKKSALYDLQGKPAYLLGISEDITEKKDAATRLAESEKRLRLALRFTGIGVWSWQIESDTISWDANMFYLFGVTPTPSKMVNYQTFLNCLHPSDLKRVDNAVRAALKNAAEFNDEYRVVLPDKTERNISVRCMIDRDNKGKPLNMTGVCLDITEQQQKHALEIKSEMISMVSHELRTPIHTIKESINVILEGLTGAVSDEQRDVLNTARQCIDRLTRLINNVLDFQKIEAGIVDIEFEKQDLNDLIHGVSEIEKAAAQKKGIRLEVNLSREPLIAEVDSDKIIQVLTNLIHNAVKFTERGTVTITSERQDGSVKISVTDTGIGFSEADSKKIFSQFGQTDKARKMFPQGTGLGLAISQKIITQHHGKIWAESRKPLGSTFSVLLPLKRKSHD